MNGLGENAGIDANAELAREHQLKKKSDGYLGEIFYSSIVILTIAIFVIANKGKECDIPAR
jgi:hypothetical protein